jgi:hypothetical protein
MEVLKTIHETFWNLDNWKYRYGFMKSVFRMYYWVFHFSVLSALRKPPKGYDKHVGGHLVGYWVWKYPLNPYNVMVIVADGATSEELAPERIYRDTPKKHQDAITLVVESDKLTFFLHVGANRTTFIPLETRNRVLESMKPYIERNQILSGIRVGLRILYHGHAKL